MNSDPQVCGLGEGVTLIKCQSQGENYSTEMMTVLTSLLPSWRPPAQSFESVHAHTWLCACACV